MPATSQALSPKHALFDRAVFLLLKIRRFGIIKKVPTAHWKDSDSSLFHNTDSQYLNVQKRILDCTQYSAITKLDRNAQKDIREHAIPTSYLPGLYIVPLLSLNSIENILQSYQVQRHLLVEAFLEVYPFIKTQATLSLNTLYDPNNYPSSETVTQAFHVDTSYLHFDLPQLLHTINPTLYAEERDKTQSRLHHMMAESQLYLRTSFLKLIKALITRLSLNLTSPTKPIRMNHITKLRDFVQAFPQRTVTTDTQMTALVQQTQGLLHGMTLAEIKAHPHVMHALSEHLAPILSALEHLIEDHHVAPQNHKQPVS